MSFITKSSGNYISISDCQCPHLPICNSFHSVYLQKPNPLSGYKLNWISHIKSLTNRAIMNPKNPDWISNLLNHFLKLAQRPKLRWNWTLQKVWSLNLEHSLFQRCYDLWRTFYHINITNYMHFNFQINLLT